MEHVPQKVSSISNFYGPESEIPKANLFIPKLSWVSLSLCMQHTLYKERCKKHPLKTCLQVLMGLENPDAVLLLLPVMPCSVYLSFYTASATIVFQHISCMYFEFFSKYSSKNISTNFISFFHVSGTLCLRGFV